MWAVLPVKGFGEAKQRLADVLTAAQRRRLSEAMFHDVLGALSAASSITQILVITDDEDVAAAARHFNALIVNEPDGVKGLNQAVEYAIRQLEEYGAATALILHGDIPLVSPDDLNYLANSHLEGSVTLSPDAEQTGTNGLICDIPVSIQFAYGENSFNLHKEAAMSAGLLCATVSLPGISLDIDTPHDLQILESRLADHTELATAQYLQREDIQQVLRALDQNTQLAGND